MKMPNKEQVQRLREIYKPGVMLKLISTIEDPYNPLPAGLCGECAARLLRGGRSRPGLQSVRIRTREGHVRREAGG